MNFGIEEALQIANQLVLQDADRNLSDIEVTVLKGAWDKLDYDQIAAQNQYATSYISQDTAPKLWKVLSSALGEKVKKSNFKEALRRAWEEKQVVAPQNNPQIDNLELEELELNSAELTNSVDPETGEYPDRASIYIMRPPIETQGYEALNRSSALIRIKAPRYMGKTFLARYVLARLSESGVRTVNLSFELADRNTHLTNLNKFLRWLCLNISRELDILSQIDDVWDEEGIGAKVSCTAYFEEYLLAQPDCPLVLCLDNVDVLFPHPEVYEDFFGLLRSWYEKGKTRTLWQNLRLIIVHATDVYIRLNINQSPFNVGLAIELPEFSPEQTQEFAQKNGIQEDPTQLEALMEWIGGHPYLLEQAFTYLKNHPETTLEALVVEPSAIMDVYQDHLRDKWVILQETSELTSAFTDVVQAASPIQLDDPMITYQLQRIGLVKPSDNGVVTRCRLYDEYFKANLT